VFYWGLGDGVVEAQSECQASDPSPSAFGLIPPPPSGDPECPQVDVLQLDVAGPNGQVNHGSMVSAFVHWLKKDGGLELLSAEFNDMPKGKGQLVRQVAQYDFGKGNELSGAELAAEVEAEEEDGDGPPEWVQDKKAAKAEAKANRK